MRLKLYLESETGIFIPYNYQYQLQSAIYAIISKSSLEYSSILHDKGFDNTGKQLKLFTFSRLLMNNCKKTRSGFMDVKEMELYFSTEVEESFKHVVLGIFSDQVLELNFRQRNRINIVHVETAKEPDFSKEMKFSCLSPITVSKTGESGKHYFDYMIPEEREEFVEAIRNNLQRKYQQIHGEEFSGDTVFEFSFDAGYIVRKQGRISKLIIFKDGLKIKAMESPFEIKADKELIKIGYNCGFGELNSAGFGMVKEV
ncbi:MAG: CRISPR-associated endoribonuclease Cas6 [Candidatus Cloacimonetes bacterium]|nr:CRISPR-associated endoribonuclease Cas6 [Candidatus Cloacimonadota bacterium]